MAVTYDAPRPGGQPPATVPVSAAGFLYRPEVRRVVWQVVLVVLLIALFGMIIWNTYFNLKKANVASGLGFWNDVAKFDISQALIEYSAESSYGQAFWVGFLNTLLVAAVGVVLATFLGFLMGIARLSSNWVIARLATAYVETIRNAPLLLWLFIWYFAVLKSLPEPYKKTPGGDFVIGPDGNRVSGRIELPGGVLFNSRGLYLPKVEWHAGSEYVLFAMLFGIVAALLISIWSGRRQRLTGQRFPVLLTTLALLILGPGLAFLVMGRPAALEYPVLGPFNLVGGWAIQPEFMALLLGLVIYTGAYIAEIVRAGILGVPGGQKEAARALGLSGGQTLRLVVIPQALRIIIPPLTSQYLNLTKNSSLAVAIAYPDLVSVFAGTVLNQTGQAVEVILITMLVYLTFSLLTSAFMNWFNARMALVER
ncbi:MAG: amino acid ABC transporter permease [Hyphomicrobiaceae bacterium]|nr:MAG: amino acid ABC transporter permease [Hyphomicrobiaceae bacterium]